LCDSISDTNFSIAGFDTLLLFFILAPCKLFMLFLFLTIFTTYTNFLTPSSCFDKPGLWIVPAITFLSQLK
ncbi:hypothetical protein ACOHX7_02510, partial [Rickettsia sp. R1]